MFAQLRGTECALSKQLSAENSSSGGRCTAIDQPANQCGQGERCKSDAATTACTTDPERCREENPSERTGLTGLPVEAEQTKVADPFDTAHLLADLKGRSVRGGMVTLISQAVKFSLHLLSTVVLARLLTPDDYGLVAMVTAIIGFAALFKDLGLSTATVQRKEITHQQVSSLFWVNVGISLVIAVMLCGCAPLVALFYHESRLTMITLALACTFIFSGLIVQHQALLRRQMKFTTLALIELGSMVAGVLAAVVMACWGAGYWALVGRPVFSAIANAVLVWWLCRWRPGWPQRGTGVRPLLKFGSHMTGFSFLNYFSRNLDHILLGRYCGTEILGFYSKAYNIMLLPVSQIRAPLQAVAMPALSRMQNDPLRYRRYYLKMTALLAFLSIPLMVLLLVCADEVILIFLGPNWRQAAPIFKILCLVSLIQPIASTCGLVLISLGRSQRYLNWGVANAVITAAAFVAGLPWGALGVAIAYTAANYLILVPSLWYCFQGTSITIRDFLAACTRPLIASVFMAAVVVTVRSSMPALPAFLSLSVLSFTGALSYLGVWCITPAGRAYVYEIVALLTRRHAEQAKLAVGSA